MLLYHYTNAAGLIGILQSKSIWAGDARFLNDSTEFVHGKHMFKQIYFNNRHKFDQKHLISREIIDQELQWTDFRYPVYVASLSKNGDLLSQWRGYNSGFGFSIGFSAEHLSKCAQEQSFELSPVTYTGKGAYEALSTAFSELMGFLEQADEDFNIKQSWWPKLLKMIASIKDGHFSEEEEYRLVSVAHEFVVRDLSVRNAGVKLIPYVPVKLNVAHEQNRSSGQLGIQQVIVGPGLPRNQMEAVSDLLALNGIHAEIKKSQIPYIAD